ncbi:hypothetical protein Tco_1250513 [Tanacetum coccineum]
MSTILGELGRLLFISPIVSGADLLSRVDYDPANKEVKLGICVLRLLWYHCGCHRSCGRLVDITMMTEFAIPEQRTEELKFRCILE